LGDEEFSNFSESEISDSGSFIEIEGSAQNDEFRLLDEADYDAGSEYDEEDYETHLFQPLRQYLDLGPQYYDINDIIDHDAERGILENFVNDLDTEAGNHIPNVDDNGSPQEYHPRENTISYAALDQVNTRYHVYDAVHSHFYDYWNIPQDYLQCRG